MLQLQGVKKTYNGKIVLQCPFLQLDPGIYWVKGANGSGKTTLLKMISGLLSFEGDISFRHYSLKKHPVSFRRHVSWAEAEPLYPSFLTGHELIQLYQSIRTASREEVDNLIDSFQVAGYINQPISTYSAGMTKKLSLLLAFIGHPPLVILDEPLITLDAHAITSLCQLILEKHERSGTTFLMSSHHDLDAQLTVSGKELTIVNQTVS
jgi:ABC-2 type transport system ATP-binding protein